MLLHETLVIADIHFRFILECSTNDNERYSSFIKCKKKDLALAKGVCFANLAKASDPIEWKVTCRALRTLGFEERNIWFEASIQFTAVQKYNQSNTRVVDTCTDTFMVKVESWVSKWLSPGAVIFWRLWNHCWALKRSEGKVKSMARMV